MKYVGKQKVLALAVMAMLASSSAYAVVDLSANPVTGTLQYIKEAKFDDTSTPSFAQTGAADLGITTPLKTGVSATDYYLRFQLSAGEWTNGTATISSIIATATTTVGGTALNPAAAYLSNDKTGFILPVTFATNGQPTDTVSLTFANTAVVIRSTAANKIPTGGKVTLTVSVFGGGAAGQLAANQNTTAQALGSASGDYLKFDGSIFDFTETDQAGNAAVIDVTGQSKLFVAGGNAATTKTVKLCEIDIKESATAVLADGTLAAATGAIDAAAGTSTLVASGKFDAVVDGTSFDTATAKGRLYITAGAACLGADAVATDTGASDIPTTLTATEATFSIGNNVLSDMVDDAASTPATATGVHSLCMVVNGTTPIPNAPVMLTYKPVAAANYVVTDKAFNKCVTLTKNGSTASVPMVVNKTSPWAQLMRITNPSTTPGKVHVYAIDDNGLRKGPMSFDLAAGASTGLITVDQILTGTGAVTLDTTAATVGTGNLNKLRLWVEGEFGAGHNGANTDGVVVRTYTLPSAAAGGSFSQFQ